MAVLIFFAFLAGVVTILSPCILPVLPIVLSGSTVGSKKYPLGVVSGFVVSFTVFTLFLTTLVQWTGVSANLVRFVSVFILVVFGLVLVVPKLQLVFEVLVSKLQSKVSKRDDGDERKTGYVGGFIVGISLGLVWTPCVGPILASVIALALSGSVSGTAVVVTFSYALGTAVPMLAVMYGGRGIIAKVPWLTKNLGNIQRVFGVLLIVAALAILFNLDRQFQTYILRVFPQYGVGLTQIEENPAVLDALDETFDAMDESAFEMDDLFYKKAPEFIVGGEWINSDSLTMEELRGKVVLVDFWTYSCINCIRTLPYIKSWHEKYKDYGLVIVGVHAPEFEFEKDYNNVVKAAEDFGLTYPIMQDNSFATWRSYNNRYWPAKYFIDAEGRIRSSHFGEGEYDESEQTIRELLLEAGYSLPDGEVSNVRYSVDSNTPETYLGYGRMVGFVSPEDLRKNSVALYSFPAVINDNRFAFEGEWVIGEEDSEALVGSELSINFESKDVFLVMSPVSEGVTGDVEVYLDGQLVGSDIGGRDVLDGRVKIDEDRLYELIELSEPGRHLLTLKFINGNVQVYAFTFG